MLRSTLVLEDDVEGLSGKETHARREMGRREGEGGEKGVGRERVSEWTHVKYSTRERAHTWMIPRLTEETARDKNEKKGPRTSERGDDAYGRALK